MENSYKKLALCVIMDAYVTKRGIEYFLEQDHTEFFTQYNLTIKSKKVKKHLKYLERELCEIEEFLNEEGNIFFGIINCTRVDLDNRFLELKRKIEWFLPVDRYPFDYSLVFTRRVLRNNE